MQKVTDQNGRYLAVVCDCGKVARGRVRMSDQQNADVWVICEHCGEKESLAEILGMV